MNYLQHLFIKASGSTPSVQPRSQSRFEVINSVSDSVGAGNFSVNNENTSESDLVNFSEKKKKVTPSGINLNPKNKLTPPFLPEKDQRKSKVKNNTIQIKESLEMRENDKEFSDKNNIGDPALTENFSKKNITLRDNNQSIKYDVPSPKQGLLNQLNMARSIDGDNDKSSLKDIGKMEQLNRPTVKISIGRLEVRTVKENKKPPQKLVKNFTPKMTLQDYIDSKK